MEKLSTAVRELGEVLEYPLGDGDSHYMRGDRVYFNHGGEAGGANSPSVLSARNFYEIRTIKSIIEDNSINGETCLEIGCGFGRLTPWLGELMGADQVIGIDHNSESISYAEEQYPEDAFEWRSLGAEAIGENFDDGTIDVVLTWTVLQHLSPELFTAAVDSIEAVLSEGGWLIACEETRGDPADHVWGRSVEEYADHFSSLELVESRERELEPTYGDYSDGGQVMVFQNR